MSAPTSDATPSSGSASFSAPLRFTSSGYAATEVQELVAEVQGEHTVRYRGPDGSPVDPADLEPPAGACLLAHVGAATHG